MFTVKKENSDTLVTIRLNGEYIALRNDFHAANDAIEYEYWSDVEKFRIRNARGR